MTIQEALMIAGQASAIMAVILLALAVRTYVIEDIRGVRDDLSGRRRMRGLREAHGRAMGKMTHAAATTDLHLTDLPTVAPAQDHVEDETLAEPHEASGRTSFVMLRDVVVCPGGDR